MYIRRRTRVIITKNVPCKHIYQVDTREYIGGISTPVFNFKPVFFLPQHPVSVLIPHPREIQAMWSQNYDRDTTAVRRITAAKGVDNAMRCRRTGYDRHNIYTHASNPDTLTERKKKQKTKEEKKEKKKRKRKNRRNIYVPRNIIGIARGKTKEGTKKSPP